MSEVIPARFEVPTERELEAQCQPSARSSEFNLHSCYYKDFFLLRTPTTINGRPAEIQVVDGYPVLVYGSKAGGGSISVQLSTISLKAVGPVLAKHGVYHIDMFYHEQLSLYLIRFLSKSSLKRFLSEKEAIEKQLSSAIAKVCALETKSVKKPHRSTRVPSIAVGVHVEVYLVSPTSTAGTSPEVRQVSLGNYSSIARTWCESKLFDFSSAMFTDGLCTDDNDGRDKAELADLQKELKGVIAWFSLGVELKVPTHDLLAIREDYRTTDKCRLEMLIRWEQLETPTWSKLVSALVNTGRKGLAENLAVKYGLPHPFPAVSASASETVSSEVVRNEQKLFSKEKELQKAKQAQYDTSRRLEKDAEDEVPKLEAQVKSLTMEAKILRKQLKHRNEELEMYEEFKPSVKEEQLQIFDRLVEEKNDQIKALQDNLSLKDEELDNSRSMLRKREKELEQLMEELDVKSAQVLQLEEEVKKLRLSFHEQQEEMNRKLIEASAASVPCEKHFQDPTDIRLTWKTAASSPHVLTRDIHAGTAVDGSVAYFTQSNTWEVLAYNSSNNSWSQLPDCPAMDCSIAIVNKMLTSIGGVTSKGVTNQLFCLTRDGKNRKWVERFPPMPTERKFTKAVSSGTHLIVAGGSIRGYGGTMTTIEVMNTTSLVWTTVANLPHQHLLYSLVECGEYLYVVHYDGRIFKCSTSQLIQSTHSNVNRLWIEQEHFNMSWYSTYIAIQGKLL